MSRAVGFTPTKEKRATKQAHRRGVAPPVHRASSRVLSAAYLFLAATGAPVRGGVIGDHVYSRIPCALTPFQAYVLSTLGTGKGMLVKMYFQQAAAFNTAALPLGLGTARR